jgi:hypothetical protein
MIYSAFGLRLESQDLALHELPKVQPDGFGQWEELPADVTIKEDDPDQWPKLSRWSKEEPWLRIHPSELQLEIEDVGFFRIFDRNRIAWSRWSPNVSDQDIRSYLLGSALGALLIQRGMLVMHGNALTKYGQAIVCVGDSGAGKSTLAYALMQLGWELLADDLVAITPDGIVLPGVQRIKLWKDAAEAFGLDPSKLTPVQKGLDKFQLSGDSIRTAQSGAPLKVCYALPRDGPAYRLDHESIKAGPVGSDRAVMASLLANVYRPHFVAGLGMEGGNFLAIATLIRKASHLHLTIPSGIVNLSDRLACFDLLNPIVV